MQARRKKVLWCTGGAALVAGGVAAFRPAPVPAEVATVTLGALQVTVEGTGTTRVRERHVVAAPVAGACERITLRPGDRVEAGAPLAVIAPAMAQLLDGRTRADMRARLAGARAAASEARAAQERARVASNFAQRELERAESLTASGVLTKQEVERARVDASLRANELRAAELSAQHAGEQERAVAAAAAAAEPTTGAPEKVVVRAPAGGAVLRVLQASEGPVAAGTPLLEIGDPAALEAVVELLTTDAVQVHPQDAVEIVRWGGEARLTGTVRLVEPAAFTKVSALGVAEQRVNAVIDPPASGSWAALGDGFHIEARVVVWEGTVLKAPSGAVFRDGTGWAAWTVRDGQVARRAVEVGRRSDREVEVTSGLAEGEQVVLYPSNQLADGVKVAVAL